MPYEGIGPYRHGWGMSGNIHSGSFPKGGVDFPLGYTPFIPSIPASSLGNSLLGLEKVSVRSDDIPIRIRD